MPPLEAIVDAGGWAVCVFTLLTVLAAVIHGTLVTGPVHAREIAARHALEAEGLRAARALRRRTHERDECRAELRAVRARARHVAG